MHDFGANHPGLVDNLPLAQQVEVFFLEHQREIRLEQLLDALTEHPQSGF